MKVLFVCRANAARSQEAEAFYNSFTNTNDASSAGIDLLHSVKGADPTIPEIVIQIMKEAGLDISQKRRENLTEQMVAEADVVISILDDYPLPEYLASSPKLIQWTGIPDPVRQPIEIHRAVRNMVKERVLAFIKSTST